MQYVAALDGLRALAVVLTMLSHAHVPYFRGGYLGVDIFFVLSGFLITGLLLDELRDTGRIRFLHFFIRRALRLYPALLLMLLMVCLLPFPQPELFKTTAVAALYLTDYALALGYIPNAFLTHTWTLAVEEHFYLLWPPLLLLLYRHFPGKRLVVILFGIFAAALAWKLACAGFQTWQQVYFRFDTRMSGLLLGAFLAAARFHGYKIPAAGWGLLLSGIAFCLCVALGPPTRADNIYFTVAGEAFAAFLILRIMDEKPWLPAQWLSAKVPVFIGRISYGIYLFHYPFALLWFTGRWFNGNWLLWFGATAALSLTLACISYSTVENAARQIAKKYRRAGSNNPACK